MRRVIVFQLLALLASSVPVLADVVELKTGERIEGAFKQALGGKVTISVAGQLITLDQAKVAAVYFGSAPKNVAARRPSADALAALKNLQSVVGAGTIYRDYSSRVSDAKATVDRFRETAEGQPAAVALDQAARLHVQALHAWTERLQRGSMDLKRDPVIIPCLSLRGVLRPSEAADPGPLAFATQEARLASQQALWSCASDKIAEAEKLIAK